MGPTVAYISHTNLRHNIRLIRKAIGKRKIMAVVKANAYGHGDLEIAKSAIEEGCEYLGVAFIEEGIRIRNAGIETPILVFGAHHPDYLKLAIKKNLEITITSENQLECIQNQYQNENIKILVHVKIDTGMNRVGFNFEAFPEIFKKIYRNGLFEVKSIYSHFSTSDDEDQSYAKTQIKRFNDIRQCIQSKTDHEIIFHMANSGAIMKLPDSYFDMVRPGIMLYGQPPSPQFDLTWNLREVMSLKSKLVLVKKIKKNEPVSYGRRYFTKENTFIGVIPIGYADGFNRHNTNNAQVLIRGTRYHLVGTVCMDMVMVNLGASMRCEVNDDVVLYGKDGKDEISISEVAARLKTIPYEVTCNVSARVPRVHLYN